ncbi:YolD-like family protein [Hydrogenibacillus sp. N12]|uniref:YolD-like family protein n=2 Tax=Hydrogenibacillus TaxID=1609627 RepID=UPI001C7D7DFB|nr:YolD-like family protein [Hydrogenibacillus sp. N12]QZA33920.1 YolD-like family protein [Hydrogenibacillus sp. N12]
MRRSEGSGMAGGTKRTGGRRPEARRGRAGGPPPSVGPAAGDEAREPADVWAASRMMLPEHAEALRRWAAGLGRTAPPAVAEEMRETIERALRWAETTGQAVVLVVYTPEGPVRFAGRVARLDVRRRTVVLASGRAVPVDRLLDVETAEG